MTHDEMREIRAAAMLAAIFESTYADIVSLPVTYACPPEELR